MWQLVEDNRMITLVIGPATKHRLTLAPSHPVETWEGVRKQVSAVVAGDLLRGIGRVMAVEHN